jgi:hypothetical protein
MFSLPCAVAVRIACNLTVEAMQGLLLIPMQSNMLWAACTFGNKFMADGAARGDDRLGRAWRRKSAGQRSAGSEESHEESHTSFA